MDDVLHESALVVPVPEAEPLVARWRASLDPACRRGVPAHVTLLYPFVDATNIDDDTLHELEELFRDFEPFSFSINSLAWFGESVLYLEPSPDRVFRDMTQRLRTAFPQYPPYGGTIDDPTPHLTVGDGAPLERLLEAATTVSSQLPLRVSSSQVWLMIGGRAPASWTTYRRFSLGDGLTTK